MVRIAKRRVEVYLISFFKTPSRAATLNGNTTNHPNDQKKGVATLYRLSWVFATIFSEMTVIFMPRKSNNTRSDGRISVQVYLGTGDGRKKYKSVYGKTQKEADQKADEIRRAL